MNNLKPTIFTILILLSATFQMQARKMVPRTETVSQSNGYSFQVKFSGDEFIRLSRTLDGCSVMRSDDGDWFYAVYDAEGKRICSGYKVGDPSVPADVLAKSRDIPYSALVAKSKRPKMQEYLAERQLRTRSSVASKQDEKESCNALIILAEFSDVPYTYTREDFVNLLCSDDSGSAKSYFNAQFQGKKDFDFTVSNIVTLPQKRSYYGANDSEGNDKNPEQMVYDACKLADDEIDFSVFDQDGDGVVDNVFVFFSGRDEADDPSRNADCIWSHAYDISSMRLRLDGTLVGSYACTSEIMRTLSSGKYTMASIGTFCHEYTHTFGIMDFYDTDYEGSGGQTVGLGTSLALMDGGNMNNDGYTPPFYNAIDRMELGLVEPEPLQEGKYTLEPVTKGGKVLIHQTDQANEYFLFEVRDNSSWDEYTGGKGLLIYHIDRSSRSKGRSDYYGTLTASQRWYYNEINCRPNNMCAYIKQGNPNSSTAAKFFFPQSNATSFNAGTSPNFVYHSGTASPLNISGITLNSDGSVSFTVSSSGVKIPEVVTIEEDCRVYQDGALIRCESTDADFQGPCVVKYGESGKEQTEIKVEAYSEGKYAVVLSGLKPRTAYVAELCFEDNGAYGKSESFAFTTKSMSDELPRISLGDATYNSQGVFEKGSELPLRVLNAKDAESIVWKWGKTIITPSANGYWPIEGSGTLKVTITDSAGNVTVISKQIVVE